MSQVLDDLVSLLSMEQIEENLFRGRSQDLGFRQLFGGQVLGHAHVAEPLDAHVLDPDPLLLRQGPWIDESEDARGVRHPEGP